MSNAALIEQLVQSGVFEQVIEKTTEYIEITPDTVAKLVNIGELCVRLRGNRPSIVLCVIDGEQCVKVKIN